jgi:hypothetical protein
MELEKMPKLCQLAIQIFINGIEPLLEFFLRELADRIVGRVMIYIWQEDGL